MKNFFTPKEVRDIVQISYRQIQYWDKSRFISPSYRRRGKYRMYTFEDLVLLKLAETLRKHGYSIQHLRSTISTVRNLIEKCSAPFEELNILFQKERILLFHGDLYCYPGLESYILFSVADLRSICDRMYESEEEAA
jgi:DNA-binding transcriptional MerR regulator